MSNESKNKLGQELQRPLLARVGEFASDYWVDASLLVLPLILAVAGILIGDEAIRILQLDVATGAKVQCLALYVVVIAAVLHIACFVFHLCHKSRLTKLQAQLEVARADQAVLIENAQAVCDGYLQDLGRALQFGQQQKNTERITLYVHDGQRFRPVGRFSFNRAHIKRGRAYYPDNQGCIGEAWEHDWCFKILPDFEVDQAGWYTENAKLGMKKTVCDRLSMKSALLCACTLSNSQNPKPVAVLVVESTDPNRYSENELKLILTEDRRSYIARLVEMLLPHLGDINSAKKEGF